MMAKLYFALLVQATVMCTFAEEVPTCSSELGCADDSSVLLQHKISEENTISGGQQEIAARIEELAKEQQKLAMDFMSNEAPGTNCQKDIPAYQNSATYTMIVKLKGKKGVGDGKLEAFVGNKVQGCVSKGKLVPFGPNAGKFVYFMMVYGHGPQDKEEESSGKPIIFKYTDQSGEYIMLPDEPIEFKSDANDGNVISPMEIEPLNPAKFELSMTETTVVEVGGQLQSDGLLLGYINGEVMGVGKKLPIPPIPPFGKFAGKVAFPLMTYGYGPNDGKKPSSGESITFKFAAGDKLIDVFPPEEHTFQSDANFGSAKTPEEFSDKPATPPAPPCADVSQEKMDAFTTSKKWGPGYNCAMFKKFNYCSLLKEGKVCDGTCGFC